MRTERRVPACFHRASLAACHSPEGHLDPEEETTMIQGSSPDLPSPPPQFPPQGLCTRWSRCYILKAVPANEYQGPLHLSEKETESLEKQYLAHGHPGLQSYGGFPSPISPEPLHETFHQPSPHQVFMGLPIKGQAVR